MYQKPLPIFRRNPGHPERSDKIFPFADRLMSMESHVPSDGNADEAPMNNKLKVLRAMRNWSQAELADRLDVSRQAVNAIETGKYDPSLPLAFKLARLFEMPIEEIFDDAHEGNKDD
ncbi:MAG: helix-turn-helix transcriptional regulator [Beijerinckiaceae bacterium]|nr:helix-turn-helix transcriptional regulator [Beijerinckiaceae bacterium]